MKSAHYAAFMFQTSEKFNRRWAFQAGWDLAMADPQNTVIQEIKALNTLKHQQLLEKGFTEEQANAYLVARDTVESTQFQYANHARARFMRGKKGIIFTFFTFMQNMVFFAAQDRGRIQFFLMMFLLAGMMGLPGAEDINALVRFASRKLLGKDFDIERATREFVIDLAGEGSVAPDLILHGISRVGFGIPAAADLLGIPMPQVDMSASLSMGRLIPGLEELGPPSRRFDAIFSKVSTDVAGATLGIGINVLKYLADNDLPWNDSKSYERALPRSLKNLARAHRFLSEGEDRTRQGGTFVEFDASDPQQLAEIVAQAAGFTPTKLSRKWDYTSMKLEAIAFWEIRRGMLIRQFDQAIMSRDKRVLSSMLDEIRTYNNELPDEVRGFLIKSSELRKSQRQRALRRRKAELDIPRTRRAIPLVTSINRLFPEVTAIENAPR